MKGLNMYEGLDFDQEELSKVMRENYDELIEFIIQPNFQKLHGELMALPPQERPKFVVDIIINHEALAQRGITVPEGILIQTSAFGDRRPTLFAVKKFLPKKYHGAWENVNWTFSNIYEDDDVSRDPEISWRPPLPVNLQNYALANNIDIETFPTEAGINSGIFKKVIN